MKMKTTLEVRNEVQRRWSHQDLKTKLRRKHRVHPRYNAVLFVAERCMLRIAVRSMRLVLLNDFSIAYHDFTFDIRLCACVTYR